MTEGQTDNEIERLTDKKTDRLKQTYMVRKIAYLIRAIGDTEGERDREREREREIKRMKKKQREEEGEREIKREWGERKRSMVRKIAYLILGANT